MAGSSIDGHSDEYKLVEANVFEPGFDQHHLGMPVLVGLAQFYGQRANPFALFILDLDVLEYGALVFQGEQLAAACADHGLGGGVVPHLKEDVLLLGVLEGEFLLPLELPAGPAVEVVMAEADPDSGLECASMHVPQPALQQPHLDVLVRCLIHVGLDRVLDDADDGPIFLELVLHQQGLSEHGAGGEVQTGPPGPVAVAQGVGVGASQAEGQLEMEVDGAQVDCADHGGEGLPVRLEGELCHCRWVVVGQGCGVYNQGNKTHGQIQQSMALLGKTLKGKSARPGGLPVKKNIKVRYIAKTQEEFDQLKQLAKMKRDVLRSKIKTEQKIVNFNARKLQTYWRKIMRIAKTEQLKNEIDVMSQNNQRELDSNEAFIQMLDKNLDEAEDQYQIALRNHLIHTENLSMLQDARLRGLQEEFRQDSSYIVSEYDRERKDMEANFQRQIKELENMIATVIEEDRKKNEEIKNEEQSLREETKNKDLEELNHIKMTLQQKQDKFYQELEQLHQKYTSDTAKRNESHKKYYEDNKEKLHKIEHYNYKNIQTKAKIEYTRLKIIQQQKEFNARNQALRKENENISRNYQELKLKMTRFRQEEDRRLKELTNNSRNAVEKLREYEALGVKILKTAEICRRLETEREKILPFYESTVDETDIPEDLKNNFIDITPEEFAQFSYLDKFLKRYNKVLLDKLAIEKQKDVYENDNKKLKSLLKQYLNGISLNDEVMKTINPLLVVNHKINISKMPVEREPSRTIVEGNRAIYDIMHQLGRVPRQPF